MRCRTSLGRCVHPEGRQGNRPHDHSEDLCRNDGKGECCWVVDGSGRGCDYRDVQVFLTKGWHNLDLTYFKSKSRLDSPSSAQRRLLGDNVGVDAIVAEEANPPEDKVILEQTKASQSGDTATTVKGK